jgi:hypothetical protein
MIPVKNQLSCSKLAQPPSDEDVYLNEPLKPMNSIAIVEGHLSIHRIFFEHEKFSKLGCFELYASF